MQARLDAMFGTDEGLFGYIRNRLGLEHFPNSAKKMKEMVEEQSPQDETELAAIEAEYVVFQAEQKAISHVALREADYEFPTADLAVMAFEAMVANGTASDEMLAAEVSRQATKLKHPKK